MRRVFGARATIEKPTSVLLLRRPAQDPDEVIGDDKLVVNYWKLRREVNNQACSYAGVNGFAR